MALLSVGRPDDDTERAAEALRERYHALSPKRRVWVLVASESASTTNATASETLLAHEEIATLFAERSVENVSKTIARDKRKLAAQISRRQPRR